VAIKYTNGKSDIAILQWSLNLFFELIRETINRIMTTGLKMPYKEDKMI